MPTPPSLDSVLARLKPVLVIPARLAATRLPDKPLAMIGEVPMIVRVWQQAMAAACGPVVVACGDQAIFDIVVAHGGQAIMTDPDLPSGSDRVAAAVEELDPEGTYETVVNLQGDLPLLDPQAIRAALLPLENPAVDVATLAAAIRNAREKEDPNVVKVVTALSDTSGAVAQALYFTRATAPSGAGPLWHHIGLYAYRRDVLRRFVACPPSVLEQRERLEQLRGLELGLRYDVARVDTVPMGVDTAEDLARAQAALAVHD